MRTKRHRHNDPTIPHSHTPVTDVPYTQTNPDCHRSACQHLNTGRSITQDKNKKNQNRILSQVFIRTPSFMISFAPAHWFQHSSAPKKSEKRRKSLTSPPPFLRSTVCIQELQLAGLFQLFHIVGFHGSGRFRDGFSRSGLRRFVGCWCWCCGGSGGLVGVHAIAGFRCATLLAHHSTLRARPIL